MLALGRYVNILFDPYSMRLPQHPLAVQPALSADIENMSDDLAGIPVR